jgi:hypothetical protein
MKEKAAHKLLARFQEALNGASCLYLGAKDSYEFRDLLVDLVESTVLDLEEQDTFRPPEAMLAAVRRGIAEREKFKVRTPDNAMPFAQRILDRKPFTVQELKDLRTWFRRGEKFKNTPPDEGMGGVCWKLMGGDAGQQWVEKLLARIEKSEAQEAESDPEGDLEEQEPEKQNGFDVTENELRFRVRNPDDFRPDTFRRKELPGAKGIAIVTGRLKSEKVPEGGDPTSAVTQSYRFERKTEENPEGWTLGAAKAWVEKNVKESIPVLESDAPQMAQVIGYRRVPRELARLNLEDPDLAVCGASARRLFEQTIDGSACYVLRLALLDGDDGESMELRESEEYSLEDLDLRYIPSEAVDPMTGMRNLGESAWFGLDAPDAWTMHGGREFASRGKLRYVTTLPIELAGPPQLGHDQVKLQGERVMEIVRPPPIPGQLSLFDQEASGC